MDWVLFTSLASDFFNALNPVRHFFVIGNCEALSSAHLWVIPWAVMSLLGFVVNAVKTRRLDQRVNSILHVARDLRQLLTALEQKQKAEQEKNSTDHFE